MADWPQESFSEPYTMQGQEGQDKNDRGRGNLRVFRRIAKDQMLKAEH